MIIWKYIVPRTPNLSEQTMAVWPDKGFTHPIKVHTLQIPSSLQSKLTLRVQGVLGKYYFALPFEALTRCNASPNIKSHASSVFLIGRYPLGFLPLVRQALVMFVRCMMSSSLANTRLLLLRSILIAMVSVPYLIWDAAIRALPSADFGPVLRPPWNRHLMVFEVLIAGARHCSLVRFDIAVHLRQTMRPPAVTRVFIGLAINDIVRLSELSRNWWAWWIRNRLGC